MVFITAGMGGGTGTGADLGQIGANGTYIDVAGKTGSTTDYKDRWFCGFTGHDTAAVWVGYDQPEQVNVGANPAAVLWRKVMMPIHSGKPNNSLFNVNDMRAVAVCLDSGKLATNACYNDLRGINRVAYANVYPGDEPEGTCDKHVRMEYCYTGGGVATEYGGNFALVGASKLTVTTGAVSDGEAKFGGNIYMEANSGNTPDHRTAQKAKVGITPIPGHNSNFSCNIKRRT